MEIIEDELEAMARVKSLACAPGERREFGAIRLYGSFHIMPSRDIRQQYGVMPVLSYRNQDSAAKRLKGRAPDCRARPAAG